MFRIDLRPLALVVSLEAVACSNASRVNPAALPSPQSAVVADRDSAVTGKAKGDSSRYSITTADVHFMSSMISHHSQAIVMSKMAPTHGASASIGTLAERIINAQEDEIVSMQQWLRDNGQPVPATANGGTTTMMSGMEHDMLMPGMLTASQLTQLDQARGPQFDRLFLAFMIQHHRGAISMVETLFSTEGAAQDQTVFKLASDVNADQSTEIDRMEKILSSLSNSQRSK
ncbi:MAG: DUF305 domain-containing protein [Gemmatimonadales bacterium]